MLSKVSTWQLLRQTWLLSSALLSTAAGLLSLVTTGTGKVLLLIIFTVSAVTLLIRILLLPISRLAADLEAYRDVMQKMTVRHSAPYKERVELTYVIGEWPTDDRVAEQMWTEPEGTLLYRTLQLTIPRGLSKPLRFSRVKPRIVCHESPATAHRVGTILLPLEERTDRLTCVVVFQPAISGELNWSAVYQMPGLWDPLRATGRDDIRWTIRQEADAVESTVTSLLARFLFPAGVDAAVRLRERPESQRARARQDWHEGHTRITIRIDRPTPGEYIWDVSLNLRSWPRR